MNFRETKELTEQRVRERRRKRIIEMWTHIVLCSAVIIIGITVAATALRAYAKKASVDPPSTVLSTKRVVEPPEYLEQLLPVNEYSRPGTPLEQVNGIVVHYTGNPGTTAQQNYSYFAGLAESGETSASSHFIIGLGGEIIQCVPLDEIAYASNERNADTISIECCIDNEAGRFNEKTYTALVELTAWLMGEYELEADDVIRHYDVTGKNCPKYFVEHESAWEDFKYDIETYVDKNGVNK